jgi:hypothetical protein
MIIVLGNFGADIGFFFTTNIEKNSLGFVGISK